MPGIQSTNLMCTSEPLRGLWEKDATSMRKKKPAANWKEDGLLAFWSRWNGGHGGHGRRVGWRRTSAPEV